MIVLIKIDHDCILGIVLIMIGIVLIMIVY